MKEKIMIYIRNITLRILERLDARNTFLTRLAYKATRKVHDILFVAIYEVSPYDYNYWNIVGGDND